MNTIRTVFLAVLALAMCACISPGRRADETLAAGGIGASRGEFAEVLRARSAERGESAEAPSTQLCLSPTQAMLENLASDYSSTLAACSIKLNKYESQADTSRKLSVGLALFGALAGSVVVPALSAGNAAKSTIAAWGGVAGATNLAQRSLNDQGLDAATYIARREMIRSDLLPALKKYSSPTTDYCGRVIAISEMAAACAAYAIAGNQVSPEAIAEETTDASQTPDNTPAPVPVEPPAEGGAAVDSTEPAAKKRSPGM